jgi:hypothetical protein
MSGNDKSVEKILLDEIDLTTAQSILNRFSTLVRESGSEDEKTAANYLESFLKAWDVPYTVHYPKLYLSVPKQASLSIISPVKKEIKAKTPSASLSTGENVWTGEAVYLPSDVNLDDKYDPLAKHELGFVKGKIVIMDGYPVSGKVKEFGDAGAKGAIFISPGSYIHEGTCSAIWGSPDLTNIDDEPVIPVLAVSYSDGEHIKSLLNKGKVILALQTVLEKGWFSCPLIDIFIPGTEEPEKYLLLHGHLDSWHVGIGDNATGVAALMEMARIFHKKRKYIKRSIRIAIWPGHSTGRYAGSAWFADEFAIDLAENCIAQVNCDSPGCRWATSYEKMVWMSEAEELCRQAIKDAVGKSSSGSRPPRAGDYSFNNIGITSFYMLSSSIPEELAREKELYPVGGCGGNIEWHTEDDKLFVADYGVLRDDIAIYLTSIIRVLNAPILPFNYVKTMDEIIAHLKIYQTCCQDYFSLIPVIEEAEQLRNELQNFYETKVEPLKSSRMNDEEVKRINGQLIHLSRLLIRMNFSRKGEFHHDPALDIPPIPDLAPAKELSETSFNTHRFNVILNHLKRGSNRTIWTFRQAKKAILGIR